MEVTGVIKMADLKPTGDFTRHRHLWRQQQGCALVSKQTDCSHHCQCEQPIVPASGEPEILDALAGYKTI